MQSQRTRATIVGLAVGLAIVFGLTQLSSLELKDYLGLVKDIEPLLVLAILILTVLLMFAAAKRWELSLLPFEDHRPPNYLLLLHYSNLSILLGQFTNIWGTVGLKGITLHIKFHYSIPQVAIATAIEHVASNLPNLFFAGAALLYLFFGTEHHDFFRDGTSLGFTLLSGLAILASLLFIYRRQLMKYSLKLSSLTRLRSTRVYELIKAVFNKEYFEKLPKGRVIIYSFLCVLINILKVYLVIESFQLDIPAHAIVLAVCGLHFLTMISPTPGGLGIYEAGFTGILVGFGTPVETAIVVALVKRVLDDLSVVCFYLAVLPYFRLKLRQGALE